ncbi:MAG: anthranilate synthase component I [Alphaproteobacteria bacterium]|nr:anthranilate synthase component I [Alphaproteobacteria bacterium]
MTAIFSGHGVSIERTTTELDYACGIGALVDALDATRGACFSSGVEYPDRYSRWEFGFINPPLEFIAEGRTLKTRAHNERGVRLLTMLRPILHGPDCRILTDEATLLGLEVPAAEETFAEEERSKQPSVLSPLRRLTRAFAEIDDTFLGLYGAFGYDLIQQFEPIALHQDRRDARPLLRLYLPDAIWLLDRRKEMAVRHDYAFRSGTITTVGANSDPLAPLAPVTHPPERKREVACDISDERYAGKVEAARRRIKAGDIFELVLSRTFSVDYSAPPSTLYRRFCALNPSPYEFFLQFGDEQLIGTSPEMYVRVEGDRVESCPIAGTVRRGSNPIEDAERIRALVNSAKDEAELTMCTDVDRNDKSRICVAGSITLLGRRTIEAYAGLFHTVDHVEGRLRPGCDGVDAFLSHMWAVTLTGAPKKMAVQLIEEMESTPRDWYGGAVGGLQLNGAVNTGITIRTVHLAAGRASYRAGASLVWDSDGDEEARETRTKATTFFRALGLETPPSPAVIRPCTGADGVTVVMIDNEDSFVHTLADYFRQCGATVTTFRAGIPLAQVCAAKPALVVHSPGPGRPERYGVPALVRALAEAGVPQFGVCLGLQGIVEAYGGTLGLLDEPRHGKSWLVSHTGEGLFAGVANPCEVGAYHSLYALRAHVPAALAVTAWNADGIVMAVRHRSLPIAAVQFHPESILSLRGNTGRMIVANALSELARPRT